MTSAAPSASPDEPRGAGDLVRDALGILAGGDDLDAVLQACAEAITRRLGVAFARVWILDRRGGDMLLLRASAGMYTHLDGGHSRVRVGTFKIGKIAQDRQAHLSNDVLEDPLISDPQWARDNGMRSFAGFPLVVHDRLVGVVAAFGRQPLAQDAVTALASVADALGPGVERMKSRSLEREMAHTLHAVGRALVSELDLERAVQTVTDAATRLTGAAYGAFFYNVIDHRGEAMMLYALSSLDRDAFAQFPLPRATAVFAPTFAGERTVRLADVTIEPVFGHNAPYLGLPAGHPPVKSYLAVPVIARDGEVLGGLFFGHPDAGRFTAADELLVEGLAGYAAVATINARQYRQEHSIASTLQRALLPTIPDVGLVDIAVRYLPAAIGAEVGGDWYDVLPLHSSGRIALSVGDVVGHDIAAAAYMGTARSALQVFALQDDGPGRSLQRLDVHLERTGTPTMITVVHGVYDCAAHTLTYARAGHPPVLIVSPDGEAEYHEGAVSPPIGVGLLDVAPTDVSVELQAGSAVVMYTDGLIEHVGAPNVDGMEVLRRAAQGHAHLSASELCDLLVRDVVGDSVAGDDVALLVLKTPTPADGDGGAPSSEVAPTA